MINLITIIIYELFYIVDFNFNKYNRCYEFYKCYNDDTYF